VTPSREAIEAVRQQWPAWDDLTIRRHLEQRAALSQMAQEQRERRKLPPTEPSKWGDL
jgi:ABC-type Na+ transport system ATPase subunit NatA